MQRTLEPELMNEAEQAKAYAEADFSESHNRVVSLFKETFPEFPARGTFLDLGCGPGDVTFRFARVFPEAKFTGVDGAQAMLDIAAQTAQRDSALRDRLTWICSYVPSDTIPKGPYDAIVSNSLLHHLHDPLPFWKFIGALARRNTDIFITDLRRPSSADEARAIVSERAGSAPEVLRTDFFNSLCAAFTPEEVRALLRQAGLTRLAVELVGDTHLAIYGRAV